MMKKSTTLSRITRFLLLSMLIMSALPLVVAQAVESINYGSALTRSFGANGSQHFEFQGIAGTRVTIIAGACAATGINPRINLVGPDGFVAFTDASTGCTEALINRRLEKGTGTYTISVYIYGGPGDVTVSLVCSEGDCGGTPPPPPPPPPPGDEEPGGEEPGGEEPGGEEPGGEEPGGEEPGGEEPGGEEPGGVTPPAPIVTPAPFISAPNGDADGDGVPDDLDNCPSVFNPGQEDGWGSDAGDACDIEWYDRTGLGLSGFEQKDGTYHLHGNCTFLADGAAVCPIIARFDPRLFSTEDIAVEFTTPEAGGWTVWVFYLHSNRGADVYQVNIYDNGVLVDDTLEIHVSGDDYKWYVRGNDPRYNGLPLN